MASNFKPIFINKYFHFYIIFKVIPRIILLFVFALEVICFHTLKYFYVLAPLFFLPLIFNYLCYMIKQRYKKTAEALNVKFEVIDTNNEHVKGFNTISMEHYFHKSAIYLLTDTNNSYQAFAVKLDYLYSRSEEQKKRAK